MDFWLPANNLGITSLNDGVIGALGQVDVAVGQCDSRMNVTNSRCISFFSATDHASRSLRLGATEPQLRTWPCSSNGSRPTGCQARPSKARLYVSPLDRVSTSAPCIHPRSLKQQAASSCNYYYLQSRTLVVNCRPCRTLPDVGMSRLGETKKEIQNVRVYYRRLILLPLIDRPAGPRDKSRTRRSVSAGPTSDGTRAKVVVRHRVGTPRQ